MFARFSGTAALLAAGLLAAATARAQDQSPLVLTYHATQGRGKMLLVPYQVAELVVPVGGSDTAKSATREADLIKTIQETISPETWASHGGRGTLDYFPMTRTLVVNQTADVQEQIADLLAAMRRAQDVEVALEVRLVTIPVDFFERIGVDFNAKVDPEKAPQKYTPPAPSTQFHPVGFINDFTPDHFLSGLTPVGAVTGALCKPLTDSKSGTTFLNDQQVTRLLDAVNGEQRADVMQAPKVTMLDGQMAHVDCTDRQPFVTGCEVVQHDGQPLVIPKTEDVVTGFRMSACPKISADRRFVQLKLEINQTDLASTVVPLSPVTVLLKDDQGKPLPLTQFLQQPKVNTLHIDKTLTIPDGGTVLFGGLKKVSEGPNQYGPPVLSKVPYVNRLFKTVGYSREAQMVYVLVTPRVIVNEEDEPRQTAIRCKDAPVGCAAPPKMVTELEKELAEESESVERTCADLGCSREKVLRELLKAYEEACAAGQTREAAKFAHAAITLDPTCFLKRREK
ncbi:MAG TPA: hypothetical protein VKA46_22620 [Gemmataceae bacterium]|nr:hypothetical protein [Gemmataceae bacterium]